MGGGNRLVERRVERSCAEGAGKPGGPSAKGRKNLPHKSPELEHLHQIFVTKNHVLCQRQRNFRSFPSSLKATSHYKPLEPNVHKLQWISGQNLPCLSPPSSCSSCLMLLCPNRQRNEDGSLKRSIVGESARGRADHHQLAGGGEELRRWGLLRGGKNCVEIGARATATPGVCDI